MARESGLEQVDDDLVLLRSDDPHDFEVLWSRHEEALERVARSILNDPGAAEEIVQETCYRAYKTRHDFRGDSEVGWWLRRMTTNLALNRVTRNHEVPGDLPERAMPGDLEHEVEMLVESEALKAAIADLPEHLRHPLLLHEFAGRSCAQIGEQLGISPGAVRVRLFRARRALAEALAGWA